MELEPKITDVELIRDHDKNPLFPFHTRKRQKYDHIAAKTMQKSL